jgi:hypothetical protein
MIEVLGELGRILCQPFRQEIDGINARSAIHPQLGQERAGKRRRAPQQRTPVKMTGGTRWRMIGYM